MALGELFLEALSSGVNRGANILWVLPKQDHSPGLEHRGVQRLGRGGCQ